MNDNIANICIYGDPVLRKSAEEVTEFDKNLYRIAECLTETMYGHENGIGLAAPQIGVSSKLTVIDLSFGTEYDKILTMVNPEIVEAEGESIGEEGCLSIPGIYEPVARTSRIYTRFQDLEGNIKELEAEDYLARVIQHEVDHLNGILFVDRLSTVKRKLLSRKLRELSKKGSDV